MENGLYGNKGETRETYQEVIKIIQVKINGSEGSGSGSGEKRSDFVIKLSEGRVVRICLWTGCKD